MTLLTPSGEFAIEHNVGARDRALRLWAAAALLVVAVTAYALNAGLLTLVPVTLAAVGLVTAATRRSPLYSALGLSTLSLRRVPSSR